ESRGFGSFFCVGCPAFPAPLMKRSFPDLQPGPTVSSGGNVTLLCQSRIKMDTFLLCKEGAYRAPWYQAEFSMRAVTSALGGTYRCYGSHSSSPYLLSWPSAPLDLVVSGMYDTPTLSVQPRPEVALGDNVTFFCHLATATSTFFLLKEGRSSRPQRSLGSTQAEFPVGPVTVAHQGTYRCFGSYNNHAWSFPSNPVMLLVTGEDIQPPLSSGA
uniref:Natural cytotoxicity triggering receptor 1 n=1 Tax=Marmota marmota marmota TaxID=9994 RepID=A0A8C5YT30_MARMA